MQVKINKQFNASNYDTRLEILAFKRDYKRYFDTWNAILEL